MDAGSVPDTEPRTKWRLFEPMWAKTDTYGDVDVSPARERPRSTVAAGAEQAAGAATLDELFRRYSPYVAKIGYRLLGRDEDVDDLVQDVFMAAHRGVAQLRDPEAVRGWLATVTVRTARRQLRRRRLKGFLGVDASPEYETAVAPGATPEQQAMLAGVYRVLDRMPVKHRIPWVLRNVQGEKLERVAEMCGCSLATVKRRIRAAQDMLHREVGDVE